MTSLVTILNTFVSFVSTEFFWTVVCLEDAVQVSRLAQPGDWLINQQALRHSYAFKRSYFPAVTLIPHTSYIFCLNTLSHIQAIVSNVTYIQNDRVPFVKALKWRLSSECYSVVIPCHRLAAGRNKGRFTLCVTFPFRSVAVPSEFSVHIVHRVQSPFRTECDRRPAIFSIKCAARCYGMHFPLFVNS